MKDKLLTFGNLRRFVSWIDLALMKLQNSYRADIEWWWYPNAMQDYDGNWYDAVQLGDQVWLAQNLRSKHTPNGVAIAAGGSNQSTSTPYYYRIDETTDYDSDYGLLYNYPAAAVLAPPEWKVPEKEDLEELEAYMADIEKYQAINGDGTSIAKALASRIGWNTSSNNGAVGNNQNSNNNAGLRLMPAGSWFGSTSNFGNGAMIWCATEQSVGRKWSLSLHKDYATVMYPGWYLDCGLSVRLLSTMNATEFRKWYIAQYGSRNHTRLDIKKIDGQSLLGAGDLITEDWQLEEVENGQTTYDVSIEANTTTLNLVIDNSANNSNLTINFDESNLDGLYIEGDRTVDRNDVKVFRIKAFKSGLNIIGVVTEHLVKKIEFSRI